MSDLTVPFSRNFSRNNLAQDILSLEISSSDSLISHLITCYNIIIKNADQDFLKDFIYLFLERGRDGEREGERHINVWLPLAHPQLGTWPATQACALDWESNR